LRSAIATMPGRKLPVTVSAELVGLAALGARVKAGGGGDSTPHKECRLWDLANLHLDE
jgi:hypothetical protein